MRATGEFSAGSSSGQLEQDEGAGHRFMVIILHFHDGLTRGALADIVDGAIAFHNHQVELGNRRLGSRARGKRQGDQSGEKPRQVTHRNPPRLLLWLVAGENSNAKVWRLGRSEESRVRKKGRN